MDDKRLVIYGVLCGVTLGFVSLASPSIQAFADGFLGSPSSSETNALNSELAAPALSAPLQSAEFEELLRAISYHAQGRYGEAIPIIGKYAMRGDATAQAAIGGMFAFGQGLPIDRKKALRWLTLAANQGDRGATELAAQIKVTPDWERRAATLAAATNPNQGQVQLEVEPQQANRANLSPTGYGPGLSGHPPSYNAPTYANPYGSGATVTLSAPMGARASVEEAYGSGSASRGRSSAQSAMPAGGDSSATTLNRAGPGTYSDGKGDIYSQAGPRGVVNTRTGEFSPTN